MPRALEAGSAVAVLTAGQQELSHKADLLGIRSHRPTDSTKILRGVREIVTVNQVLSTCLLSCRIRCNLEEVSWAHECTPAHYRNEL